MNKILAIGTQSDLLRKRFTGQSVMFDGIVDSLNRNGDVVKVININSRFGSQSVYFRSLDYAIVLLEVVWYLVWNKCDLCYITTAQSKKGFLRDNAIIGLAHLFRVKVIAHQYGANYKQLLDALGNRGKGRLIRMLNHCTAIIVEGQYMKGQYCFLDDYEEKVRVIPNGLPIVGKSANQPKVYLPSEPFKLYYLSNLIWSKGYFDVLKAVDLLVNKYNKNVECVFSGAFMSSIDDERDGVSNKLDFDQYIKEHKLENKVSYYTGMYGAEKDAAFFSSNVFLLPTYYINEGQPVSIIEAMAYGCVPIVTEYRHIPMMVTKGNGCFVEPRNPEQIADTIVWLMEHPEEYSTKSELCIRDYQAKFTFDKYASKVLECMSEAINKI